MYSTSKSQTLIMIRSTIQTLNSIFIDALLTIARIALLELLTQRFVTFVLGDMMLLMTAMNATRIMQLKSFESTCKFLEL